MLKLLALVISVLAGLPAHAPRAAAPDAPAPDAPACISWRTLVRYRNYGYDHIVEIKNGCESAAICEVTTDVAPEAVRVRLAVSELVEVLTFRGSPAYVFKARVRCSLEPRGE